MLKYTLKIDGMACGMCEAHVKDVIRKYNVSRVTASASKGIAEFVSEEPVDEKALSDAINATGYKLLSISNEPYEKKKFRLFGR